MKAFSVVFVGMGLIAGIQASPSLERTRQMERSGDSSEARNLLSRAAQSSPEDATALAEYAVDFRLIKSIG